IALLPYLIWEHRRHRHLSNPILYLGFFVGLIPTCVWLWLSWLHYGNHSFEELIKFVVHLGFEDQNNNGRLFYVWNIPLKAFPWAFFGILGLVLSLHRPIPRYHKILVGFPLVLFVELSLFSTRFPHYSLCLYPFIALFASVGLNWLGNIYNTGIPPKFPLQKSKKNILTLFAKKNLPRNLSYVFGGLGVLLVVASIALISWGGCDIRKYASIGLAMGLGWLILPVVWITRYHFGKKFLTARYWIAGWLIPCWLALATTGSIGLLSDYNPVLKTFLQESAIAPILQSHPIYYVQIDQKTEVLLDFYLSIHPQQVVSISHVPTLSYALIYTNQSPNLSRPHRLVGTVNEYQLIQVLP
ncbi:MAG: phospholipid carrier-dependent glycosyltransferase, partial [Nostoc sp.]